MRPVDIFEKYKNQIYGIREKGVLRSSGFAIEKGILVTVSHPLQYPDQISVISLDGNVHDAQVLGWDNRYDLAVLAVDDVTEFIPSELADKIHPGLEVYTMGIDAHGPRIHGGLIAQMLGQKVLPMGGVLEPSVETDGTLNASMSGGFLIDGEGKLIGMNSTLPRGSGMTIAMDQLKSLVSSVRKNGTAKPAYIGISTAPARDSQGNRGLVITEVEEDSPGTIAGLRTGDLLNSLNGQELNHPKDLFFVLRSLAAGQNTEVVLQRDGKSLTLSINLGER